MSITHRTTIVSAPDPAARAVMAQATDGFRTNTRVEISPAARGLYHVTVNQAEKHEAKARGITRSISFVISRAGLDHLVSVGS